MLARLDPASLDRVWFPLGDQGKEETRAEAERGRARGRAARREPGGVLPRRRRLPRVPRPARARTARGRDRRRGRATSSAHTTASGASPPASARPSASRRPRRCTSLASDARANTVVVGPHEALARRSVAANGRLYVDVDRAEAKLRYRSPAVPRERRAGRHAASSWSSTSRPTASRRGQAAVLYEGDAVVGCGVVSAAEPD